MSYVTTLRWVGGRWANEKLPAKHAKDNSKFSSFIHFISYVGYFQCLVGYFWLKITKGKPSKCPSCRHVCLSVCLKIFGFVIKVKMFYVYNDNTSFEYVSWLSTRSIIYNVENRRYN